MTERKRTTVTQDNRLSTVNECDVQNTGECSLTYRSFPEHISLSLKNHWKRLATTVAGLFVSLFGFLQITEHFTACDLSSLPYFFLCATIAIFASIAMVIRVYLSSPPEQLKNESKGTWRTAIVRKHWWEYKLAYQLLSSRLSTIDDKIKAMLRGIVHVPVKRSLSFQEYISWMQIRPSNYIKMVEVAKQLLVFELTDTINRGGPEGMDIEKIVDTANRVRDFYSAFYEMEMKNREIQIPEEFQRIHEIQSEWANVIRDPVVQMLRILEQTSNRHKQDTSPIVGTIDFIKPPKTDEFMEELSRIERKLPELLLDT